MPNVTLDSTTADEHVLLLADLYWDWDKDTGTGSASLDELKEAGPPSTRSRASGLSPSPDSPSPPTLSLRSPPPRAEAFSAFDLSLPLPLVHLPLGGVVLRHEQGWFLSQASPRDICCKGEAVAGAGNSPHEGRTRREARSTPQGEGWRRGSHRPAPRVASFRRLTANAGEGDT